MAFNIRLTDGTLLTTVDDGTIDDTSCAVTLIGKNYVGYGTIYNDNLVHLLENFSSDDPPSTPLEGQLWWDKSGNLKVYTGSVDGFKTIGTVLSTDTEPANGITGQSYWNTDTNQLYVYNGTDWVLIGPINEQGTSGLLTDTITDTNNTAHTVSKMFVNSQLVGIWNKDQQFTPNPLISGFANIKPGFNFVSNAVIGNIGLWGSASQLGGIDSAYYARTDISETFDQNVTVVGNLISGTLSTGNISAANISAANISAGNVITVGNLVGDYLLGNGAFITGLPASYSNTNVASYLPIYTGNLESLTGNVVTTANVSAGNITLTGNITAGNVIATANVVADVLVGTTKLQTTLITTGSAATAGTITGTWALSVGSKLEATYADLAEKFSSDDVYEPGTIVKIGGEFEITKELATASDDVLGVISTNPAYLMNSTSSGLPVVLSGRVPVKVIGKVNKGDRLISAGDGLARAASLNEITAFNVIGRSLENKYTQDQGIILAFVSINK